MKKNYVGGGRGVGIKVPCTRDVCSGCSYASFFLNNGAKKRGNLCLHASQTWLEVFPFNEIASFSLQLVLRFDLSQDTATHIMERILH